jgi:hypothetical protein
MSKDFPLFGKSLETFHYSAKVSNLGKFLGIFLSNLTKNSGNCLFFLLYKCHKKFVYSIWQTTTFHYLAKV